MPLFKALRFARSQNRLNDVEGRSGTARRDWSAHSAWCGLIRSCSDAPQKHRNLLAHAPEPLHEEISADYNDMVYAGRPGNIGARRELFIRKWRLNFTRLPTAWRKPGTGCSPSPGCPTAVAHGAGTCSRIELQVRRNFLKEKAAA